MTARPDIGRHVGTCAHGAGAGSHQETRADIYLRAGDGPPRLQVKLPGMSDTGMTLPSVSSLLKWARGESEHERPHEQPVAVAKRPFSKLGVGDDTIPAPLTAASIERAMEELPQGAGVALESCLTAFKVTDSLNAESQNRSLVAGTYEFALPCRRLFAYVCGGSGREIACLVHASSRPCAADMRTCHARCVSCSPNDCRKQNLWRLRGRSCGKALLSPQRSKRPRAATRAWR
jgi:hypothetical protein